MSDSFNEAIAQVYRHLSSKEVTEAVMLGEEILSDALDEWGKSHDDMRACRYVAATCAYATALLAMQRQQEAYAACMAALAYTARNGVDASGKLALLVITWRILEATLSATAPSGDGNARGYVAGLTAAVGSLMYKYYYEAGNACAGDPVLPDAYAALSVIMGLVDIDPSSSDDVGHISAILRISETLGLIQ